VIRGNVFHDGAGVKYGGWGVYLDEGSSDAIIEQNLVYRTTHGGLHLHYGANNVVRNNIFAFGGPEQQIVRTQVEDHGSFTFEHNIVCWQSGPMTKTGPQNVTFDHNLYGPIPQDDFRAGGLTWDAWRAAGEDVHSLVADPRFVDAERGDFHLQPASPAEKIGFKPFDDSKAGPRKK
jgi:parallel beta-helix repeat protein